MICAMPIPKGSYLLYKDDPERMYRRIAAKVEEIPFHLQFYCQVRDGAGFEMLQAVEDEVKITSCATTSEAIQKADEERELSLQAGWHDWS